jgi:hypothetical protein
MCKWAFGPKHDIIHTICQIIKFFKETRLIKFFKSKLKTRIENKLGNIKWKKTLQRKNSNFFLK